MLNFSMGRSGTDEEYGKKEQLLQEWLDLAKELEKVTVDMTATKKREKSREEGAVMREAAMKRHAAAAPKPHAAAAPKPHAAAAPKPHAAAAPKPQPKKQALPAVDSESDHEDGMCEING